MRGVQNCVADKKRIFKLAEELKIEALEIIAYLKSEGIEGISAASHVDGERVQDIKDHFSGKKTKKKPAKREAAAETKAEVAKVDEGLGLVFGWAIVSKVIDKF